jgi:hypothetical protein
MPMPIIPRRTFLRSTGVAMALPLLDAMRPRSLQGAQTAQPQRFVAICATLGIHAPYLFPDQPGRDYSITPYLKHLKDFRREMTVLSGLSHPDQAGADGHSSEQTWLTAATHPGLSGFRNSISIDQWIAESIGLKSRYPSLQLGTSATSQSYTRSGVMMPSDTQPSALFARLFLDGNPEEVEAEVRKIREGQSIMDTVGQQSKRLERQLGQEDRDRLAEYVQSVREMEQRLQRAEELARMPKPKVDASSPTDIVDEKDLIGRMQLMMDLIPLAIQTDSSRVITVLVHGRNDVPPVAGVSIDHHNLSHHGQDEAKIQQLKLIEEAELKAFATLLTNLKAKQEAGQSLLDNTTVLFGSNLGNANSHDTRNLPIVVAGGGFQHGQYLAFDAEENKPLSNLFVQIANRMGVSTDSFGTSNASSIVGL